MTTRDPRHRGRRYDGAVGRRELTRWIIRGIRVLAVPTAALSLLLAVDIALPGTAETGITYRRALAPNWLAPDGVEISVGWPDRPNCLDERPDTGRRLLFTTRPGCAGSVAVSLDFGRRVTGNDTLRVFRTPVFGRPNGFCRAGAGQRHSAVRWTLLH